MKVCGIMGVGVWGAGGMSVFWLGWSIGESDLFVCLFVKVWSIHWFAANETSGLESFSVYSDPAFSEL
jgi:hypothetical protein